MKKIIIVLIVVVLGIGALMFFNKSNSEDIIGTSSAPTASQDYKNIAYQLDGQEVKLENGSSEMPAEMGSTETVTTTIFGNSATADFNGDAKNDTAFILMQSGAGTGIFFYVAAAVSTPSGLKGTNAIFLGDRISPQTTEFKNGKIIVNYADRKPGEPFSAEPSVGVSKYLTVNGLQLVQVSK
jgi:hypothetical protein